MDVFQVFHECDPNQVDPNMTLLKTLKSKLFYNIFFNVSSAFAC